jgi:hypothetical protein
MKYVYLIIALFLFASCEVAEIEDFSVLTQDEKDAILDQLEERRDVSYLLEVELDTITIPNAIVTQRPSFSRRDIERIGQFSLNYSATNCDDNGGDIVLFGIDQSNYQKALHLKDVISSSYSFHRNGFYRISLVMDADSMTHWVSGRYPCDDFQGGGGAYPIKTDSLHLYGYSEDEASFVVSQINRIIPAL